MNPRIRLDEVEARRAAIQSEVAELDALEAPSEDEATRAETLADEFATLTAEAEDRATQGVIETVDALRQRLTQTLPAQLANDLRDAVDLAAAEDTARELIEKALRDTTYQPPAAANQSPEGTP